jgi:hypothetical protein
MTKGGKETLNFKGEEPQQSVREITTRLVDYATVVMGITEPREFKSLLPHLYKTKR